MTIYFQDAETKKLINLGSKGKSGMDVSPLDIPLKGDVIIDDYNRHWEVVDRQHFWSGPTHDMTLHLKLL